MRVPTHIINTILSHLEYAFRTWHDNPDLAEVCMQRAEALDREWILPAHMWANLLAEACANSGVGTEGLV